MIRNSQEAETVENVILRQSEQLKEQKKALDRQKEIYGQAMDRVAEICDEIQRLYDTDAYAVTHAPTFGDVAIVVRTMKDVYGLGVVPEAVVVEKIKVRRLKSVS